MQAGLVITLLFLGGCDDFSVPPPLPKSSEVVKAFEASEAEPAEAAEREPRILLYVDNSASMRGFAVPQDTSYRSALDFLLDRASSAEYGLRVHRFSEKVEELGSTSVAAVVDPTFYVGRSTSFPDLFRHIGGECGPRDVAVVVSDLVQSGTTGDQRSLVQAFKDLTQKRRSVLLLAFRSAFAGRYFVEGRRSQGTSFELSLNGKTPDQSRPFYMLLIAGSPAALAESRELLLPDIAADETFEGSSPALPLQTIEFIPPSPSIPVWNVYKPSETLPGLLGPSAEVLSFIEISPPAAEATRMRLRLQCAGDCASGRLRSPERLSVEIARRSFRPGKWSPLAEVNKPPEALYSRDGKAITLDFRFPRPSPLSWDVYQVRVRPGAGNLQAPLWMEEWSTPNDSTPMLGHLTYKLDLFVEAMVRSIQEQVPLSEHYILLGRGE
jgi:hypothetical protein